MAGYQIVNGKIILGLHFRFFVINTLSYKPINITNFCVLYKMPVSNVFTL